MILGENVLSMLHIGLRENKYNNVEYVFLEKLICLVIF